MPCAVGIEVGVPTRFLARRSPVRLCGLARWLRYTRRAFLTSSLVISEMQRRHCLKSRGGGLPCSSHSSRTISTSARLMSSALRLVTSALVPGESPVLHIVHPGSVRLAAEMRDQALRAVTCSGGGHGEVYNLRNLRFM